MRRLLPAFLAALLTLWVAGLAGARTTAYTYKGTATGLDGKFRYGPATVKRTGDRVTSIEVKAVSATCAGTSLLRTIVYRSSSRSMKIVKGSNKVKSGVMSMTFSGKNANGQFNENGLCYDVGKFKAKR
jgi:hypothetical protein